MHFGIVLGLSAHFVRLPEACMNETVRARGVAAQHIATVSLRPHHGIELAQHSNELILLARQGFNDRYRYDFLAQVPPHIVWDSTAMSRIKLVAPPAR